MDISAKVEARRHMDVLCEARKHTCSAACLVRCRLRVSICFPLLATFYCFYQLWELRARTTQLILSGQKLDNTHIYNSGNSQEPGESDPEWRHVWPAQARSSSGSIIVFVVVSSQEVCGYFICQYPKYIELHFVFSPESLKLSNHCVSWGT